MKLHMLYAVMATSLGMVSLAPTLQAEERPPLQQIAIWTANPESCERAALLELLKNKDVRVRSAALDLLESVTGKDFGLDPWVAPNKVPHEVQQALQEWAAVDSMLGDSSVAPSEEQLRDAIAVLKNADPDTMRRLCVKFAPFKSAMTYAIQQELEQQADVLSQQEQDNLRCAQFRVQLQDVMPADAGHVASKLTSHVRNDTLDALEMLREVGVESLPVVMTFTNHSDTLVREVAVDVLLDIGLNSSFAVLMPSLMEEQDRNILQIAARRAIDCAPTVEIILFLNKCATSDDEDVSLAGLEALAELAGDSDERPTFRNSGAVKPESVTIATAQHGLTEHQFIKLMQSPHWRVRAATLNLLSSSAAYVPSVANQTLQELVVNSLKDDDETVRQAAVNVIYKRSLARKHLDALAEFAQSSPKMAPYVVYLFCESGADLPPGLQELLTRFTLEEVNMLAYYDAEQKTVFAEERPGKRALTVLMALLRNPDPGVRTAVMKWCGRYVVTESDEMVTIFCNWMQDAAVSKDDKLDMLASGGFHTRGKPGKKIDAFLKEWLAAELDSARTSDPTQRLKLICAFCDVDEEQAARYITVDVLRADIEVLECLLSRHSSVVQNAGEESIIALLTNSRIPSYRVSSLVDSLIEREKGCELIMSAQLPVSVWRHVISSLSPYSLKHRDGYAKLLAGFITQALDNRFTDDWRAVAVLLTIRHAEYLDSGVVESVRNYINQLPAEAAELYNCVREFPKTAAEVESWARKYHNSANTEVRKLVAACLLPLDGWSLHLIVQDNTGDEVDVEISQPMSEVNELKRVSCPATLIRLVEDMQTDADASVALRACSSMLYRTGDCNRARYMALLKDRKKAYDAMADYTTEVNVEREMLSQVWGRWKTYRSDVEEPFKLKGSPKRLKKGLENMLQLLAELSSESWGLRDEVAALVNSERGSQSEVAVRVDAFSFNPPPAPPAAAATVSTPDETPDASAETEDNDEPDAVQRLDRNVAIKIEFFHKEGCDTCKRVLSRLDSLRSVYPKLHIVTYDVESEEGSTRNAVLCERFGVQSKDRRKAPALFAEAGYLLGERADSDVVSKLLDASITGGKFEDKLSDAPSQQEPQESIEPTVNPDVKPAPNMLAESSAQEEQKAQQESSENAIMSYGVLLLGILAVLGGLLAFLKGRKKHEDE